MDFTGPLGLVAAKCFLAVFLSIFSVQRRQLAAFSMPLSSQMLLRKLRVSDRERHGYLSDCDVTFGSKTVLTMRKRYFWFTHIITSAELARFVPILLQKSVEEN
jgi:hypothetical protein